MTEKENISNRPADNSDGEMLASHFGNASTKSFSKPSSPWLIVWAGLSISLPILFLYIYSCKPDAYSYAGVELKQISGNQNIEAMLAKLEVPKKPTIVKTKADSTGPLMSHSNASLTIPAYELPAFADTAKHRILLIGDSETEGLRYPLNDYCVANGHKLVLSLAWYSASVFNFGRSDTIEKIIAKYKPTYIVLVIGLNELYAKDLKERKMAANLLASKLGNIPYSWIGPANWIEDNGINQVFESSADSGTYFLTKNLQLTRAADGRHPDVQGYRVWMDQIAIWLQTSAKYKMTMKPPSKRSQPFRASIIGLNAAKFRGY